MIETHTINLDNLCIDEEEKSSIIAAIEEEAKAFCECGYLDANPAVSPKFKTDGVNYLGVTKHGWLCPKCKKFVQIG